MMCQWCDNPKDLLEETYNNYCLRCGRYSKLVPEDYTVPPEIESQQDSWNPLGYLEHHACVWEYRTNPEIPNTYFLRCINPVRTEKSSEYSSVSKKCRKNFSLTKAEYDADEEKRVLTRKLHSYEWLEEANAHWAKIDKIKKDKEVAQRAKLPTVTPEDYKDDPNYQAFLKFKDKAKSG